jgi:hypothetical protein
MDRKKALSVFQDMDPSANRISYARALLAMGRVIE